VVLSIVLFLALPLSVLVVIDHLKVKAEIKAEVKEMRRLREKLERENNGRNSQTKVDLPDGSDLHDREHR
jgi:hypothetical protein